MFQKLFNFIKEYRIIIPVPCLGCGVLGLALIKSSKNLGQYASTLLKALEYRGFDSTGAAFQDEKSNITLLKDVGAPSTLVETLGINKQAGKLFCGQVRWATFGQVDKVNSQPHIVECKRHLFGAHNGNITNTRELKQFLTTEGHNVLSDNDGEIVVHMVEHYFDVELTKENNDEDTSIRKHCMRRAIAQATAKLIGSFAAIIIDPKTEVMYSIKAGSSLYFGVGSIENESFNLASSDLTAVLRFTKNLVDLKEGEFVEYTGNDFKIFAYKNILIKRFGKEPVSYKQGEEITRVPTRSKLRAEDTQLLPQFDYFMEQEIYAEVDATRKLIKLFTGGSNSKKYMLGFLEQIDLIKKFKQLNNEISNNQSFDDQKKVFDSFCESNDARKFLDGIITGYPAICDVVVQEDFLKRYFFSNEKNLIIDLIGEGFNKDRILIAKAIDSLYEQEDVNHFAEGMKHFDSLIENCIAKRRNIYTIACGSSYHAAKIGAVFFNDISGIEFQPTLPGDFRGQYNRCLRNDDIILGVSQSGETKDLIDIFDDIDRQELDIRKIVLVNNLNSTLGQEKSDISIPVYCGPEIAIPATKSFINQVTVFYYLAIRTLGVKVEMAKKANDDNSENLERELRRRMKSLENIPGLIRETLETTRDSSKRVAEKIFLSPSMHIMATKISGVAKEAALKIRETVLNHTEGGEASEFKHGPNTILGINTVYGMDNISGMIKDFGRLIENTSNMAEKRGIKAADIHKIIIALSNYVCDHRLPFNLSKKGDQLFNQIISEHNFFKSLYRNYPLLYITGPDERDVNLTISQINTHKIRGADTIVIAEDNDKLAKNAGHVPDKKGNYQWDFIKLPKTDDTLMTSFTSTIAMQLLALEMSIKKMNYLDKMGMEDHGVHPDIPKNVSKSITVD